MTPLLLLSFDCDGTLWCGRHPGPVSEDVFLGLLRSESAVVGITGNWKRCPHAAAWGDGYWLLKDGGGWERKAAEKERVLRWAGAKFFTPVRIHVGDEEPDRLAAERAGWLYLTPEAFVAHTAAPLG